MKKLFIVIAVMSFIFLIVAYLIVQQKYYRGTNYGELIVVNKAEQEIITGSIEVCKQKLIFINMRPNESRTFSFKIKGDSGYRVSIKFASGQKLAKEIGYVTSGFTFKDSLIIKNDDIILESRRVIK